MQPETLYTQAVQAYENGSYAKAHDLFAALSVEIPAQPEIWQGLAACNQARELYPEALMGWSMAALLGENDPLPHFHAAECLYAQGNREEALKAIRIALSLPCTEELLEKMVRLKEVIDHGQ